MSHIQQVLIYIVSVLTAASLALSAVVLIYLLLKGEPWHDTLGFTVVLVVASIPIAMEIVTTTTLSLGSKELASHGAIVTRLAAIEDMAGMAGLCSDKTGTLTLNKMVIQENTAIFREGETQYSLLRYAAMAAKWKEPPKDALDTLILNSADLDSLSSVEQTQYLPFNPVVKRTEATITENGHTFRVTKGAPHVLMRLTEDRAIHEKVESAVHAFGQRGIRSLGVAISERDDDGWKILGLLTFLDPPREDTKEVSSI